MATAIHGPMVSKHRNSKGQTLQGRAAHTVIQTLWTSAMMICHSEVQNENDLNIEPKPQTRPRFSKFGTYEDPKNEGMASSVLATY